MNERIKAIGRQAGFAFIEDGIYGQRWYSSKCGMDASEFEKFAELIVRECISALDKEVYIATREDGEQACHEVILLEHFGVTNE